MSRVKKATANLKNLGYHLGGVGKKNKQQRSASYDEGGAPKTPMLDRIARMDMSSRSSSFSMSEVDETEGLSSIDEEDDDLDKELELYKTALHEESNIMKGVLPFEDGTAEETFENEERSLLFIRDSMLRSQQLTDQMENILDSFENRLSTLETTIYPIHKLMQNWKLAHENVDKTMASISKVLDIFDTASKVQEKINDGARGEYDSYLACVDMISEAALFLTSNKNFKSSEKALAQLKVLLKQGLTELENIFKSLIMKHSNPIDPTKLPEKMPERNKHLEIIPANAMEELKKIVKRFGMFGYTNHLKDYKDKRSKYLVNSMRKLNPEKIAKENNESKTGYSKGSHKFIEFIRLTLKLFQAERDFGVALLHQIDGGVTFEAVQGEVLEAPLELLEEATETLIKSKHNTADLPALFFGVFVLFDIWEEFNRLVPDLERAVKVRNGKHNDDIAHLEAKLRQVCQKSFSEFEEDIKKDSLKMLPVDATVHELTSNTVNYLKRLIEYKDTVEALLPRPQTNSTKAYSALREFIIGVLSHLRDNLESKAKREKKTTLANIFLLNNYHYMLKTIRTSEIMSIMSASSKLLDEYERAYEEQLNIYSVTWDKAAEYLALIPEDKKNAGKPPTSKEKSAIKSKLSGFNSEMEEQFHTQKNFSVPDAELQTKLRSTAKSKIIPLYGKFMERYGDVQFTKNKGKYLRYSLETLDQMLDQFFAGNAAAEVKKHKFKF